MIVACFTVHGIVTVAATPMSKMRGEHALSTLAFLFMLAAYQALSTLAFLLCSPLTGARRRTVQSRSRSEAPTKALTYASFGAIFLVFYAFSFWVRFGAVLAVGG